MGRPGGSGETGGRGGETVGKGGEIGSSAADDHTLGKGIGFGLIISGALGLVVGIVTDNDDLTAVGGVMLGAGIIVWVAEGGGRENIYGDSAGGPGEGTQGNDPGSGGGDSSGGTSGGGGCFSAGTPVLMADGGLRAIETLVAGDQVLSRNERTGVTAAQRVSRLWVHQVDSTLRLDLADGEQVETTREHRFFVPERGFVGAGQLGRGALLATGTGSPATANEWEPRQHQATVYNIEVENFHTFFVGHAALWVHNEKITDPSGEN